MMTETPRLQRVCFDISGRVESWPNLEENTRRMLTVKVIGNMIPKISLVRI